MACLDGTRNFVCGSMAPNALVLPPTDFITRSSLGFCNCVNGKRRIQNSINYQSESSAFLQLEADVWKNVSYEAFIVTRCSDRCHTERRRHCGASRRNEYLASSFWLAPQRKLGNLFNQISTERLASCQVCGPSSSPTSDDGQYEPGLDGGRSAHRVHDAAAHVPSTFVDTWKKNGETIRSKDYTTGLSSGSHGNGVIADHLVTINDRPTEVEFNAEVVNDSNSAVSLYPVEASSYNSQDSAILRLEGGHLLQSEEKQGVNNTLRSLSNSQLDQKPHESPVSIPPAEELAGKTLESTGAAADALEVIEGGRPITVIDRIEKTSPFADNVSRTLMYRDNTATQTTSRSTGFWEILNNDTEFLAQKFSWAKEVAVPMLADRVEKVVWLRLWEDESFVPTFESPYRKLTYSELTGRDLLAADIQSLKGYIRRAKNWLKNWRIPLEPVYQPEMIADYFNRRPHVLLIRVLQISATFGSVFFQLEIEKALNGKQESTKQIEGNDVQGTNRWPELLKDALVKLGPTFIKVGQSLSTRPDLVGAETAKILAELQDNLAPFPTPQAIMIIEREFGQPWNEVFSHISEKPVAAASFGQVYKALTPSGQEVAIKVQRPNLLCSIALDIYILRMALGVIRRIAKRRNDLKLYADELGQGFFGELDYMKEAANAAEFQAAHASLSFLEVPNIILTLSTRKVLTMEWVDGDRPVDLLLMASGQDPNGDGYLREKQLKAKQRLFSLVNKGVEASLVQLLETGIVHADPHPGNLLYKQNDQMVFLDFGLLCRMEKKHQLAMIACIAHIVNAEWKNFVDDLADMEVLPRDINRIAITLEMEEALADTVPKAGVPDIKFSKVLVKVLAIALKHQFKMPPYFILVLRSIASLEGLALAVDPNFKVFAASYPFVLRKLLTDKTPRLRSVFISLVLNERKEFRWDRLASLATLARQHTMQRAALETGMEIQNTVASNDDVETCASPVSLPLLVNLLASKDGYILRRLILEADTYALARAFNSRKAAAFRRNVATAMANAFYQPEQNTLKKHRKTALQDSSHNSQSFSFPSKERPQESSSFSDTLLRDELKFASTSPDSLDGSLLQSRRLRFLLRTAAARLRRTPLLLLNTVWSCLSMFCYAIILTAQRLVAALVHRCLPSKPATKQRIDNQLVLARA